MSENIINHTTIQDFIVLALVKYVFCCLFLEPREQKMLLECPVAHHQHGFITHRLYFFIAAQITQVSLPIEITLPGQLGHNKQI